VGREACIFTGFFERAGFSLLFRWLADMATRDRGDRAGCRVSSAATRRRALRSAQCRSYHIHGTGDIVVPYNGGGISKLPLRVAGDESMRSRRKTHCAAGAGKVVYAKGRRLVHEEGGLQWRRRGSATVTERGGHPMARRRSASPSRHPDAGT
jgi:hypothetical protein